MIEDPMFPMVSEFWWQWAFASAVLGSIIFAIQGTWDIVADWHERREVKRCLTR